MAGLNEKIDWIEESGEIHTVKTLKSRKDAKRITDFFLSEDAFDDRNFTKGEICQLKRLPFDSLKDPGFQFWYIEGSGNEIIGVISLRENEQRSGGYFIDYMAVHRHHRHRGIASQLIDVAIKHVHSLNGRYLQANTCDTSLYESARDLYDKKGFSQAGCLPDYYFKGEGMIIYYKKM
jgi:GNAT superfamily N-acetyltransferase